MKQSEIAARLVLIEEHLAQIAAALARTVPPADVRASMAESTEHIADVTVHMEDAARDAPPRDAQISAIIQWMHARMSGEELEQQFGDQRHITQQLIPIMQGTRDDLVLLRGDFRRLAALLEQTLRARVEDAEAGIGWDGFERRAEGAATEHSRSTVGWPASSEVASAAALEHRRM